MHVEHDQLTTRASATWGGVDICVADAAFSSPPTPLGLSFRSPTLRVILEEVGGGVQFQLEPSAGTPPFYGPLPIAFLPSGMGAKLVGTDILDAKMVTFTFPTDAIEGMVPSSSPIPNGTNALVFADTRIRECAELLATECETPQNSARYGKGLMLALIAALGDILGREPEPGPRLSPKQFELARAFIVARRTKSFLPKDIAQAAGLPTSEFNEAFARSTGVTPQKWQLIARVHQAQRLMLADPRRSLATISALLGFADQSHFSRGFNKITGQQPSAWLRGRS